MQNHQRNKINTSLHMLRANCRPRRPFNILQTTQKLLGCDQFKEHIGVMLGDMTPIHLGKALDKCVLDHSSDPRMTSVTGWYTITITNCLNIPNSSILLALKYALTPLQVQLFNFKRNEGSEGGEFLVDNKLIANRMKRLNGKVIVLYTTKVINLHVQEGILPSMLMDLTFNSSLVADIEAALLARYDAKDHSLHLTRFHASPELLGNFCALYVVPMLQKVLQLIAQKFPQLRVLQLRDNYLCTLSAFDEYPRISLPNLQVLDVSSNNITGMMELKNLRDMKLRILDITSNPLAKIPQSKLRAMLQHVDHIQVDYNRLSPLSENYSGADSTRRNFCIDFAKKYYTIFNDLNRRKDLASYYDTDPNLSLDVSKVLLTKDTAYSKLFDVSQYQSRPATGHSSNLFTGQIAVMHVICNLPEMQINIENCQLYIHIFNILQRSFTMTGCFKEINSSGFEWRNYSRQFVMGRGKTRNWTIYNDTISITLSGDEENDCKTKLSCVEAEEKTSINIDNQLEELNNYFNNTMQLDMEAERSTPIAPTVLEEMPPLVKRDVLPVTHHDLESEVEYTLLFSDDEAMLVVNEDELLEGDDL